MRVAYFHACSGARSSACFQRATWATLMLVALMTGSGSAVSAEVGLSHVEPREQTARSEFGVSLLAGFGAGGKLGDSGVNRYGPGFGARAGVTFRTTPLYLGVSFIRFLGGEADSGEYYTSTLDAEVGYSFRLLSELVVVRPQLALGVAQPVTIQSDNAGYPLGFHCAPGLLVGIQPAPLFLSAELRRDILSEWSSAATFMLGGGLSF
jgi:hypothetical protein